MGGRTRSIESSREAFPNAIGCLRRRRAPLRGNACHINKRSVCRIAAVSSDLRLGVKGGVGWFGGGCRGSDLRRDTHSSVKKKTVVGAVAGDTATEREASAEEQMNVGTVILGYFSSFK